jgi:hypothetical protein
MMDATKEATKAFLAAKILFVMKILGALTSFAYLNLTDY